MLPTCLFLLLASMAGGPHAKTEIASVELTFSTHAGEGAEGVKRFFRDGCYTIESSGGTGGGWARDSQAGCHRRRDLAALFARADALSAGGDLGPARAAPKEKGAGLRAGPADRGDATRVTLVRGDGSRWMAANANATTSLAQALAELPGDDQSYPTPPDPATGKGPALVVLSVARSGAGGSRRLQASLVADGRWWCYRSIDGRSSGPSAPESRAPAPPALAEAEASARLARILRGARAAGGDDADAKPDAADPAGLEISVEVAFGGGERDALHPRRLARTVADRFVAEMRRQSPACAAP